ncbi:hypothetical protein PBY51_009305 [Eleginops maclovinus]|uniref:Uncharacterized protein n=1 Tax=Eleginops maclovinus TaxID=56733 RepID=A0AAN7XWS4_ELEMC|nr:hypothetical protein PBY51_009305 [Eleginops maclovinus]
MQRGQQAQGAKKLKGRFLPRNPPQKPSIPDPEKEAHQAEARSSRTRTSTRSSGLHRPEQDWIFASSFQDQRKGAKLAGLAEQSIIFSGVGLAVESHGEEV